MTLRCKGRLETAVVGVSISFIVFMAGTGPVQVGICSSRLFRGVRLQNLSRVHSSTLRNLLHKGDDQSVVGATFECYLASDSSIFVAFFAEKAKILRFPLKHEVH